MLFIYSKNSNEQSVGGSSLIRICMIENDWESTLNIEKAMDRYFADFEVKYETDTMTCETLISTSAWAGRAYDLAIIDLSKPKLRQTLMEYSVEVRKPCRKTKVIFVSDDLRCVLDTFDYAPDYYIYKPQISERFAGAIERLLKLKTEKSGSSIVLSTKSAKHIIPQSSILYFEHYQHNTKVVCENKEIVCHEKLSSLLERLNGATFIRCHCSFIVNLEHVRKFTRTQLLMSNGDVIPCSRSNQKPMRVALESFDVVEV